MKSTVLRLLLLCALAIPVNACVADSLSTDETGGAAANPLPKFPGPCVMTSFTAFDGPRVEGSRTTTTWQSPGSSVLDPATARPLKRTEANAGDRAVFDTVTEWRYEGDRVTQTIDLGTDGSNDLVQVKTMQGGLLKREETLSNVGSPYEQKMIVEYEYDARGRQTVRRMDNDGNGTFDFAETQQYEGDLLAAKRQDTNNDGTIDQVWTYEYDAGLLAWEKFEDLTGDDLDSMTFHGWDEERRPTEETETVSLPALPGAADPDQPRVFVTREIAWTYQSVDGMLRTHMHKQRHSMPSDEPEDPNTTVIVVGGDETSETLTDAAGNLLEELRDQETDGTFELVDQYDYSCFAAVAAQD